MRLRDKVALVTGAASGFGAGIAERFAAEGAKVAIVDINATGARAKAAEIGENAFPVVCDLTKAEEVDRAVTETVAAFGGLDIVVNNAGWTHRNKPLLEVTEAEFDRIYAINVKAIFLMTQRATPVLRDRGGGSFINIGSTAGVRPRPGLSWYNGSKGFVNLVSKSLAVELAPWKIRVNCIAPVLGQTGLTEDFMGGPATPELLAKFLSTIPLGRMSKPSDIAAACVYLASDAAAYVTGQTLHVNGGMAMI